MMRAFFWTMIGLFIVAEIADKPWTGLFLAFLAALAGMGACFVSDLREIAKEHALKFHQPTKSEVTDTKEQQP